MCKNCEANPVYVQDSGKKLCKGCFGKYFEKKVFKTIRQFNLIKNNDKIGVAISGGKDSLTVLYLLNKIASEKRDIELVAILIDEGIKGYRDETIKDAKKVCKELGIKLKIYSFKKEFGKKLDELFKKDKKNPCTTCGVLRRYLLNKYSRKLKVNKLATGHNMDDEAQSILMNQFKNQIDINARLGPVTGVVRNKKFIRRIKPLYFMSEKEVTIYSFHKKFLSHYMECPIGALSYRGDVRDFLNNMEEKYSGTKNGLINSYIEIMPLLKEKYKTEKTIKYCERCNEPCSQSICKTCKIMEKIKNCNKRIKF